MQQQEKGKGFGTGGEFHTRGREMQPRRCALLRDRRVRESIMSDEWRVESGELSVVHHLSIVAYVYTAFGVTTDATAL